ncbi:MAG: hypothetical protein V3U79_05400 [Dehalococcoidia bacterium]
MVIAIGILLSLVCLVIVAIPFLRHRHSLQPVNPLDMIDELARGRQQIYQELTTLKEGHQLGNVPEAEFQALSLNLRRRAAENLWLQRRWEERLSSLDEAIEGQVLAYREAMKGRTGTVTCPECEGMAPATESSCPVCGTPLAPRHAVLSGRGDTG